MQRVTGVGGIFFRASDPEALRAWYKLHLGVGLEPWGGSVFSWNGPENPTGTGSTVWSVVAQDSSKFAKTGSSFMVNYRVVDLHALVAALRAEGCNVDDEVSDSEYGIFGWVTDPEGNRIELWQPPAGQ
jgi:predicted enzyme related to lactoylglutathione lyase